MDVKESHLALSQKLNNLNKRMDAINAEQIGIKQMIQDIHDALVSPKVEENK